MENLEEKQVWGKGNVEDQEFGFGQVSFELPVKLQMEAPRRWLDIRTCCPAVQVFMLLILPDGPQLRYRNEYRSGWSMSHCRTPGSLVCFLLPQHVLHGLCSLWSPEGPGQWGIRFVSSGFS